MSETRGMIIHAPDEGMGLCDSETGATLHTEKVVHVEVGDCPISLAYATAKRGRIVQVRRGCARSHYFIDEPLGRKMIEEDEKRNGVTYSEILKHAPVY